MIDIQEKKKKIITFLENNGPSLPVRIAKAIEMDPVFASAISSELLGSKQIKTSHMKIGASPLYLLPGQEQQLEDHTDNLKSIENEAYKKIKERKIMTDEAEEPATRVALRNIKDFATPFKFNEKIMWRYSFATEDEIQKLLQPVEKEVKVKESTEVIERANATKPEEEVKETEVKESIEDEVPKAWKVKKEEIKQAKEESKKIESIFEEKPDNVATNNKNLPQPATAKKTFLKQVEEFLEEKNTKIISIEEVDKKKVIAKTESENEKALLFAFNKKKINEEELIKCYKRAKLSNLPYHIIIIGNLTKKMDETIDAYKKLLKVEKLNNTQPQSL